MRMRNRGKIRHVCGAAGHSVGAGAPPHRQELCGSPGWRSSSSDYKWGCRVFGRSYSSSTQTEIVRVAWVEEFQLRLQVGLPGILSELELLYPDRNYVGCLGGGAPAPTTSRAAGYSVGAGAPLTRQELCGLPGWRSSSSDYKWGCRVFGRSYSSSTQTGTMRVAWVEELQLRLQVGLPGIRSELELLYPDRNYAGRLGGGAPAPTTSGAAGYSVGAGAPLPRQELCGYAGRRTAYNVFSMHTLLNTPRYCPGSSPSYAGSHAYRTV